MAIFILVVALLIVLVTLVFAIANGTPVTVNLVFFGQIPTQLSLAIIVPFLAGVAVGLLVMVPGSIKNSLAIASHKRRISALEKAAPSVTDPGEPPEN